MKRLAPLFLLFALPCFMAPALAVQDNIGHKRHEHRHGKPHPKKEQPSRFHTNRTGAKLPLPGEQEAFSFVVFGDRTGGPAKGVSALADAVRDTNLLEPDLVMTVGDLVQGYNQTGPWLKQMEEYKGIMDNLLCPWFPVAGNHDVYWRGEGKPAGEHEANYEMHFGPLWYAFEHKNSWFVVLYSDEGNPLTGNKTFTKPDSQIMSPGQFEWLDGILKKASGAEHVFLFLHHPRWVGGRYGKDWDRVHKRLVQAGNVTAVFAGHIHYMRSDPKDGIEYVTLATVGGHQDGLVPQAGWLHQYHVVTVRKDQVALSAFPVGQAMDVREIDGELVKEAEALALSKPTIEGQMALSETLGADRSIELSYKNESSRPLQANLFLGSEDSRWKFAPDHVHGHLEPGESLSLKTRVLRDPGALDSTYRNPQATLQLEYLMPGFRYTIPSKATPLPLSVELPAPVVRDSEMVLAVAPSRGQVLIPHDRLPLDSGPFTLDFWAKPGRNKGEIGMVAKTESSEFGMFMNDGAPSFYVHLNGRYVRASPPNIKLKRGEWVHLAGTYDGEKVSLYVNGKNVASAPGKGQRTFNNLPLVIGADVSGSGEATRYFKGSIDAVHLRNGAAYSGDTFTPLRRPSPTEHTVLLLNMDAVPGPWLYDESQHRNHPNIQADAVPIPSQR